MPRVPPIKSESDLAADQRAVANAVMKVYGEIRGPWTMLLYSPRLTEKMLPLTPFFWNECIVEGKLRSVAILAVARERESEYVWAAQVGMARRNGVREEIIDLLRAKSDPAKYPDAEQEIVTYTFQLIRTNRVEQAVFDALKNRYGTQWLVELTAVIGYFGVVSGIANAFEVPAPADGDRFR